MKDTSDGLGHELSVWSMVYLTIEIEITGNSGPSHSLQFFPADGSGVSTRLSVTVRIGY
jgi:hypothetical protein